MLCCPVDVEFAVDLNGKLHIVQVRPVTRLAGGSSFNAPAPTEALIDGTLVSEGIISGPAISLHEKVDPASIPKGAIIHVEKAKDWMIETDVLKCVGGFILKNGGTNDHVAITLRQAGIPCLLAGEQFKEPDGSEVTLVSGLFHGEKGAYLLSGNHTEDWQSKRTNLVPDYAAALAQSKAYKKSSITFKTPDQALHWLNQQNDKLLTYFEPDRLFNTALAPEQSKALSMNPGRSEVLSQLKEEVDHFLEQIELFLQGYEAFLNMAGETKNVELNNYLKELEPLKASMVTIRTACTEQVEKLLAGLTDGHEIPDQPIDFKQWLGNCKQLKGLLQNQQQPNSPQKVHTVHEMIMFLHKRFVAALGPIAANSSMGDVKLKNKTKWISFSNPDGEGFLNDECKTSITHNFKEINSTVTQLPTACIITSQNGIHLSTIGMYEKAEGTKGRKIRLSIAENLHRDPGPDGRCKRLWFLASLLKEMKIDKEAGNMSITFNPVSEKLEIECCNFRSKEAMTNGFLKVVSAIPVLERLHLGLQTQKLEKYESSETLTQWSKEILAKKIVAINTSNENPDNDHSFKKALYFLVHNHLGERTKDNPFVNYLPEEMKIFYRTFYNTRNHNAPFYHARDDSFSEEIPKSEALKIIINKNTEHLLPEDANRVRKEIWHIYFSKSSTIDLIPKEILTKLIMENIDKPIPCLKFAADKIKNSRYLVKQAVSSFSRDFIFVPDSLKNDDEIVEIAITKSGLLLEHASVRLKSNKDIVIKSIQHKGDDNGFRYANQELMGNKEIALLAIKNHPKNIKYISDELKDDEDIVKAALKGSSKYDGLLQHAGKNCKKNPEIINLALKHDETNSAFISKELTNNPELILPIIKRYPKSFTILGPQLRNNKKIMIELMHINKDSYKITGTELKNNEEFIRTLIKITPEAYTITGDDLLENESFLRSVVTEYPATYPLLTRAYRLVNSQLRNDEVFVRSIMSQYPEAYDIAGHMLCENEGFMRFMISKNSKAYEKAGFILCGNENFMLFMISKHPKAYEKASSNFRNNEAFVISLMESDPENYKVAGTKLRNNQSFMLEMMQINQNAFHVASQEVKASEDFLSHVREKFPSFKV